MCYANIIHITKRAHIPAWDPVCQSRVQAFRSHRKETRIKFPRDTGWFPTRFWAASITSTSWRRSLLEAGKLDRNDGEVWDTHTSIAVTFKAVQSQIEKAYSCSHLSSLSGDLRRYPFNLPGRLLEFYCTAHCRLTIDEAKALASYPKAFEIRGGCNARWPRIGNSFPPLFMRAIASHLRRNILRADAISRGFRPPATRDLRRGYSLQPLRGLH